MKTLIMTTLLAACFTSNLMAATDKTCYPFQPNQEGYNRICVALENSQDNDTNAAIEIYRNEKLVNNIDGQRIYNPQEHVCSTETPSFCYRKYEALRIVSEIQDLIKVEVFMRVHKRTTCLYGNVSIKEQLKTINLSVECPVTSWKANSL